MVKLIAIDLDDTLLNSKKEITAFNKEQIKAAIASNVKIVIASGRPLFRVRPILEELGLNTDDNYVISYNGAYLTNALESIIIKREVLNNIDICNIVTEIEKYHLDYTVYVDDTIYTPHLRQEIRDNLVYRGIDFKILDSKDIMKLPYANKIIVAERTENIIKYAAKLKTKFSNQYNVLQSSKNFLEFLGLNASKGQALKELLIYLKIDKELAAAIGDEENDLPMFNEVSHKIAMKNANPILIKHATFVTESKENSGVGTAIAQLLTR